jgi:hypothetical protein
MKYSYLKARIGGAVLTLSLLFGIGLATTQTAQAQWGRNNDQYRRNRDYEREQRRREREYRREQQRQEREARRYGGYGNNGYGNDRYGGYSDARQTALNAGYNNGIEEGRKDRSRGERYEFRDEGDYQKATEDYNSRFGDREMYRRYFRQGFENGYRAGYNGY